MKISIDELRGLPQQKLNLNFRENIEELPAVKPVLADLVLSATSTGIKVSGTVQTLLKLTCDRCLSPYFLNISIPLDDFFVEHRDCDLDALSRSPRERELTAQDFVEELSDEGVLDITDLVYQAVTLATPVSCLCGDDCPGPAFPHGEPESGSLATSKESQNHQDRIDPRWKNLKTLFPKEETE